MPNNKEAETRYKVVITSKGGVSHTYRDINRGQKDRLVQQADNDPNTKKVEVSVMSGGSRGGKERF